LSPKKRKHLKKASQKTKEKKNFLKKGLVWGKAAQLSSKTTEKGKVCRKKAPEKGWP